MKYPSLYLAISVAFFCLNTEADPRRPGGDTTTDIQGANAFSQPANNLSFDEKLNFSVGNSFFRNPWVSAPATTTARDGLGPLFNTNSCQGCHIKDGRGHPPEEGQTNLVSTLIRISIPESKDNPRQPHQSVIAEPTYGDQLQDFSILGIKPEVRVLWRWSEQTVKTTQDNKSVSFTLREPVLEYSDFSHGDLHPDTMFSPRVAPSMIGLGLLESISEQAIRDNASEKSQSDKGVSGRVNEVWGIRKQALTLGRFGWKAGQPTVEQQNSGAFLGDMGLTSTLHPESPCTEAQADCLAMPNGEDPNTGTPEVPDETMEFVTFYARHLAPPARPDALEPSIIAGENIFTEIGCAACHQPSWQTAKEGVSTSTSDQTIYPYTDLLLHDMGEGLADNRPEFVANGKEWRTPPLWGLGDYIDVNGHTQLLHDGRARNATEAILWHGGESEKSVNSFNALTNEDRLKLLNFLESL